MGEPQNNLSNMTKEPLSYCLLAKRELLLFTLLMKVEQLGKQVTVKVPALAVSYA